MNKTAKRLLSAVLALVLVVGAAPAVFAAESEIANHWAKDALTSFFEAGYLKGDQNGNLNPDSTISRAEFAALVNRVTEYRGRSADIASFTDVAAKDWYYDDMAIALGAGYMQGSGATMMPTATVTREQAFLIVARLLKLGSADESVLAKFSDAANVSSWAKGEVAAVVAAGIVQGSNGKLNPQGSMTRAEAVTVLHNAIAQLKGIGKPQGDVIYGTASLTYAEFYAGLVSSTDGYDAVSSATNSKSSTLKNTYSDFVDAETNANGYHILGVKNVAVAVSAKDYDAYIALNPSFNPSYSSEMPAQYKNVKVENGKAIYTQAATASTTVTGATAMLQTGTVWGDYQINVTDPEGVKNLRNTRSDEGFAINSQIQGIILETSEGYKVGMEALQNIWVQPYEVSFNVSADNSHNAHIAGQDNLSETDKLMGKTITKITYIMPDATYVYEFDGIYIKPVYTGTVTGSVSDDGKTLTLDTVPSGLKDAVLTVVYTVGSGRQAQRTTVYEGPVAASVALAAAEGEGTYSATIASSNYANISVKLATTVYALMNIPYDAFYKVEGASFPENLDAISSATNKTGNYGKASGAFHSGVTAEVAEDGTVTAVGGANGSQVQGVIWPVAISSLDLAAIGKTEVTDKSTLTIATVGRGQSSSTQLVGYECLTEAPAYSYYVLASMPDYYLTYENGSFSALNGSAAKKDALDIKVSYGTNWGDVQINVPAEDASDKIVNAVVVTAEDGTKAGFYHLDQIWSSSDIAWKIAVTKGLDGKKLTNIRYFCTVKDTDNADGEAPAYVNYVYDYPISADITEVYSGSVTAEFVDANTIKVSSPDLAKFENLQAKVYYTTGGRNATYTYLTKLVVDPADDDIDPVFVAVAADGTIDITAGSVTNKAGTTGTWGNPVDGTTYTIEFACDNYIVKKITVPFGTVTGGDTGRGGHNH